MEHREPHSTTDQGAEPPMDVTDQWLDALHDHRSQELAWKSSPLPTLLRESGALCLLS